MNNVIERTTHLDIVFCFLINIPIPFININVIIKIIFKNIVVVIKYMFILLLIVLKQGM